jgi:hypothetical protein
MDIVDMGGTMSDLRDECSDLRIEIAALRAKLETVTRENTRLTNATLCDVCGGTGQPPPEVCACEGTHQAWKVLENVRLENVRLESRIAALEAAGDALESASVEGSFDELAVEYARYRGYLNVELAPEIGYAVKKWRDVRGGGHE